EALSETTSLKCAYVWASTLSIACRSQPERLRVGMPTVTFASGSTEPARPTSRDVSAAGPGHRRGRATGRDPGAPRDGEAPRGRDSGRAQPHDRATLRPAIRS